MSDLTVACSLMPAELQERRRDVLSKVRGLVSEVKELENGFAYQFPSDGTLLPELANLIQLERQCSHSFRFALRSKQVTRPYRWR